jgi:hypothetical protein
MDPEHIVTNLISVIRKTTLTVADILVVVVAKIAKLY